MTDAELTTWIRRLVLEEQARLISAEAVAAAKTDAITLLAQLLVAASPDTFVKKVSLAPAHTNAPWYDFPSDNEQILQVWDYDGNAATISGAADNGSGLVRITHNGTFADEAIVTIHDIVGTTEANGTWETDYVDSTHLDLVGSTLASAYTSGGKMFEEKEDTYKYPLERRPSTKRSAADENTYFYKGSQLVVDDPDFTNDLIVEYRYLPTALSELPSRLHMGVGAYSVLVLQNVPPTDHPSYGMVVKNRNLCDGLWMNAQKMASNFAPVGGDSNISKRKGKYWF